MTIDLSSPSFKSNPYPEYARIRAEQPISRTTLPNGVEVYLVTRYADVQAGLKDPRLVKNIHNAREEEHRLGLLRKRGRLAYPNNANMLRADPPEHTRLRALAHEAFTPHYVSQLRGHIQQIADGLLDAVQERGKMDLIQDFAFPLPITVICEMLGVPLADDAKFRRWSQAVIDSGILSSETPLLIPEMLQMAAYLKRLIAKRRKDPQDDLISRLINADQQGDRFSPPELLSTTVLLLIAGHETTVNLIGNGTLALLQNPDQMAALRQDPAMIKPAVEELLRYVNPVQMVNRYAAEDLEICGVPIPRGSHLMLVVAAANHDPDYAPQAERLTVANHDQKHVAFGQGIHYCLGAPLARLEGEIAFTTLLRRLPGLRLDQPDAALEWRPSLELRGLRSLPVVF